MAPTQTPWKRLVRYISAKDDGTYYGEPIIQAEEVENVAQLASDGKLEVTKLLGTDPMDLRPSDEKDIVRTLLGPVEARNTPIMRCIGLNYKSHSEYDQIFVRLTT